MADETPTGWPPAPGEPGFSDTADWPGFVSQVGQVARVCLTYAQVLGSNIPTSNDPYEFARQQKSFDFIVHEGFQEVASALGMLWRKGSEFVPGYDWAQWAKDMHPESGKAPADLVESVFKGLDTLIGSWKA